MTCKLGEMASFSKVFDKQLFVSEPNPAWFGNPANEQKNPNWTNANWLKSRFHFSFAEYNDPNKQNFGVLRVMNDDLVQPNRGFGTHPHREMEIISYVVHGQLSHQDSMGSNETIGRGSIQYMTAGTGVSHSEHNLSKDKDLRFIQIWIVPKKRGLTPNYGSFSVPNLEDRRNKLAHLVSDVSSTAPTPVKINQDLNLFATELDENVTVNFVLQPDRQAYMLCMEGEISVAGSTGTESLSKHDAAAIRGKNEMQIRALQKSHVLLLEMAKTSC